MKPENKLKPMKKAAKKAIKANKEHVFEAPKKYKKSGTPMGMTEEMKARYNKQKPGKY
jgi:hypothetical protein